MNLDEFLVSNIFAFMLVFARLGATFMFLPGFSATYVNRKARLAIALLLTLVVTPVVVPGLPALPMA